MRPVCWTMKNLSRYRIKSFPLVNVFFFVIRYMYHPASSWSCPGSPSGWTGAPHQPVWAWVWQLSSLWPLSWAVSTQLCPTFLTWNPLISTWALASFWSLEHSLSTLVLATQKSGSSCERTVSRLPKRLQKKNELRQPSRWIWSQVWSWREWSDHRGSSCTSTTTVITMWSRGAAAEMEVGHTAGQASRQAAETIQYRYRYWTIPYRSRYRMYN
jgi:hypothetical protein